MKDENTKGNKGVNRRKFLKGAGAGLAATAAAAATMGVDKVFAAKKADNVNVKWDMETDVVVIGYGGAGAATAITAADKGAKVILMEKLEKWGGATRLSGGAMVGAGTKVQKELGVKDSAKDLYKFLMAVGGEYVDSELVKMYAYNSADAIDWIMEMGGTFPLLTFSGVEKLERFSKTCKPTPRGHFPKDGEEYFKTLSNAVEKRDIKVLMETPAQDLFTNDKGEVVGVLAERKGKKLNIRAKKSVVLTSGGFNRNREMLRAFSPEGYEGIASGCVGCTGDSHVMARALGADLIGVYGVAGVATSVEKPAMVMLHVPIPGFVEDLPCVSVNKYGKRYANETINYDIVNQKIYMQDDHYAWTIFDDYARSREDKNVIFPNQADGTTWSENFVDEIKEGILKQGSTFEALAKEMGIDPKTFEETMLVYNKNAKLGKDPEFGKSYKLAPVDKPPFYAVKVKVGFVDTSGGLKIDPKCRVVNTFGKPIPRLYAAGTVHGGLFGNLYPASGVNVGSAVTFGRIAGKNAAAHDSSSV